VRFPFVIFPAAPHPSFPGRKEFGRPIVPVVLRKSGSELRTLALLDSGADDCLFAASVAKVLRISIPNQRSYRFSVTAAAPQVAYFEVINVEIMDWQKRPAFRFELDAGFSETVEHMGFGLLGQHGFFSRFKVTFNQAEKYFEIESRRA
jgi:hypothetical protein